LEVAIDLPEPLLDSRVERGVEHHRLGGILEEPVDMEIDESHEA
jgi:hypothetical protein